MHKTHLYDAHIEAGARMVDFVGWNMPINYGSQMDEHKAVRSDAGMFDVSHMTVVDIRGPQARDFLLRLLANRPRILLLDEPTANLDPAMTGKVEQLVMDYLAEQRAACLWVTHAREQIERIGHRELYLDAAGLHEAIPA